MRTPRISTERVLKCPPVAILLTGVGYIGATLLRQLQQTDPVARIVVLENYFCTAAEDVVRALPSQATLVEGDVAQAQDVARAFDALGQLSPGEPLTVFHLAAQPSAAIAVRDPETTERTNLVGARLVLEAARQRNAHVVFGGSFRVYGDELDGQTVTEDTPYGTVGDLSHLSKIYVEHLARMLRVRCVSVRLGVTYGVSPIMKADAAFMTVPNVFCKRAAAGESLTVLEDRPVAFVHVEDAARALCAAARHLQGQAAAGFEAMNAAPDVMTVGALAHLVQRIGRQRGLTVAVNGATGSEQGFVVRSQLETRAGFRPEHRLSESLSDVLAYWLSR